MTIEERIAALEERLARNQLPDTRSGLLNMLEAQLVISPEMVGGDTRAEFLRLAGGRTDRTVFTGTANAVFAASATTTATVTHNTGRGLAFAVPALDPSGTGEVGFSYGVRPLGADPTNAVEFLFRTGTGAALTLTAPFYYLILS